MNRKLKKYKVGLDSETYAISLVEMPAIEVDFVALEKEEEKIELFQSEERHICYGPALIPDKDIYRISEDGTEYYLSFTKESISKMSQEFMREYRQHNVTLDHNQDASEVYIVESWLVEDSFRDKSNALGFDVPVGTWMVAMKVNNIDTWERIKDGSLKGFSVESMISLEDFNKIDDKMNMEINEMTFWQKMKETLMEVFKAHNDIEEIAANSGMTVDEFEREVEIIRTELEEQAQTIETPPTETIEETVETVQEEVIETKVEEKVEEVDAKADSTQGVKVEEANPLEETVKNLLEEIKALKEMNNTLQEKVTDLGKKPSADPINTNGKQGNGKDAYSNWREQMRKYM